MNYSEEDYKEFEAWYLLDPDADTSMLEKDEFGEYVNSGTHPLFSAFSCGFETAEHRSIETIYKLKSEINDLKQQIAELHASRVSWVEYSQKIESGEFVLVQKMPTPEMTETGIVALLSSGEALECDDLIHAYRAMIEASQQPTNLIDSFIADGGFDKAINEVK